MSRGGSGSWLDTFNSLSRDHSSHISCITMIRQSACFQLPLSGSRHLFVLAFPAIAIATFNSLSRDHFSMRPHFGKPHVHLSTPSLGITADIDFDAKVIRIRAFNSLSRDHSETIRLLWREALRRLSTPSLGIT